MAYTPRAKNAAILDRAYELVQSVPYTVSLRWVFYRLLQEGFYHSKSDYQNQWENTASQARHAFYKGWRPDTLADETRTIIYRSQGFADGAEWVHALAEHLECPLDNWQGQQYYVMLWFEARAMIDQFRHYTQHVDLVPMAGKPSIPFKWDIAKQLESAAASYGLPMVVLYFGDLDETGEEIPRTVEAHVRKWCRAPFEFVHAGLTLDQAQPYDLPESVDKPGAFQWEALDDASARTIITEATAPYFRHDGFQAVIERERAATEKLRAELRRIVTVWGGV